MDSVRRRLFLRSNPHTESQSQTHFSTGMKNQSIQNIKFAINMIWNKQIEYVCSCWFHTHFKFFQMVFQKNCVRAVETWIPIPDLGQLFQK